jgi:hypothetical protein
LYSPFLYEYLLQKLAGVSAGTILEVDRKLYVILETDKKISPHYLSEILQGEDFEIKYVDKIPRDPRHQSKIDDQQLRRYF